MDYCEIENLISREQHSIDSLSPGYNILKVAGSSLGFKHSEETLTLKSFVKAGENHPMFSKKGENHPRFGKIIVKTVKL